MKDLAFSVVSPLIALLCLRIGNEFVIIGGFIVANLIGYVEGILK